MRKINYSEVKAFLSGNIYMVLLWRLLLLFVLYALMRIGFYLLNYGMFGKIPLSDFMTIMKGGYRFDKTAIFYLNIPVILMHILPFRFRYNAGYQKIVKYIFVVVNSIGIIANMADAVYYRFTLKRTTMSFFNEFGNENPVGFLHFIWDYWYISLIVIVLTVCLVLGYGKIRAKESSRRLPWFVYYPLSLLLMAFIGYQSVGAMRGGWTAGTRPITLSNAAAYISKPEHRAIVLNTPFALIRTIGKVVLEQKKYFSQSQAEAIFPTEQTTNPRSAFFAKFKNRNVVIIIWESFAREWVGGLNRDIAGYKGYTPFIDSLLPKSYVFKNAFANGRKSIDAIPSVIASIPALETPFILSNYSGNKINSLASLLKKEGYYSAFFHGAPNGSMGFDAFAKQAGFDAYFGMSEYGNDNDFDGHWGIWDEPFLQFMANKVTELPQPFLVSAFTLSSHDPFVVPKAYKGKFPKGFVPNHQCVGYSDFALKRFFDTASKYSWYSNTLFVITADHAVNGYLPEYKNAAGAFAIPMIFFAPESDFTAFDTERVVQQVDVMPSVLSLLGDRSTHITFGNDMFDAFAPHFAVNYFNGAFQLFEDSMMLQFIDEESLAVYDFNTDFKLKKNLMGEKPIETKLLENRLKSFLQQFNNRLIEGEMTIEKP